MTSIPRKGVARKERELFDREATVEIDDEIELMIEDEVRRR